MNYKSLLIVAALAIGAQQSFAQQRVCDMSVSLVSPAEGATINADAQYNITVAILNNGPADLIVGDTLHYNTPMIPSFSLKPYILQQAIPAGGTATILLESAANHNTNPTDFTEVYCVKVLSHPNHLGAFIDTVNVANNRDCNEVILKASNPTSLKDVAGDAERLSFYPNPTMGDVTINFESFKNQDVTILVRDITGKVLSQQGFKNVATSVHKFNVPLGNLSKGLYLLELRTADRKATGKLVVQ